MTSDHDPELSEPVVRLGKARDESSFWERESRQRAFMAGRVGEAPNLPEKARQRPGESLGGYYMRRQHETGSDPNVGAHERAQQAAFPEGLDWATLQEEDLGRWLEDESIARKKRGK